MSESFNTAVGVFNIASSFFQFIPLVGKPKFPTDLLNLLQTELKTTLNDLEEHRDVIKAGEYEQFIGKIDLYHDQYTEVQVTWTNGEFLDSLLGYHATRKTARKILKRSITLHKQITDASNAARIAKLKLELTPCSVPQSFSQPREVDLEYPPPSVSRIRANRNPFQDSDSITSSNV